jgi:hypothetical protein
VSIITWGFAPHPTKNFLLRKFPDFKELYKNTKTPTESFSVGDESAKNPRYHPRLRGKDPLRFSR